MSSNDHKKFKTDATQKTSTDTEIISDTIVLPPYSTDHVLVVTANPNTGSSTTTTETTTQNVTYPAQDSMLYYFIRNNGQGNRAWFETTDNVFKSYDFSQGISWYFSGAQGHYHVIDKTEIFKVEFTDGSYIKWTPYTSYGRIEYRDGTAGDVKTFTADSQDSLLTYLATTTGDDAAGGNEFEQSAGQADTYTKTAFSVGPNGYKITTAGDYDSTAQSIQTLPLTAGNGASWSDLDFSSKTHSKTILFFPHTTNSVGPFRPDIFSIGRRELTFNTLLCKYDANDAVITGGTDAIADAFSKDYDRFFLFSDGDQDDLTTADTDTFKPVADVTIKSHGDSGAVTLEFKAENYTNPSAPRIEHNWTYTERTDLPNWHNLAGNVDREVITTTTSGGSSVSGQVDVELEMSPDGKNWCPVLTKVATAGTGGSTGGVSAEDANLKAVSTTPTVADPYKNKFALGSLSYDNSGAQVLEDQGTRDFMQSFMSKDKPFNYSLWLKTDTAVQAFADDYTPVLFRHGGKDKFTNTHVVQTDNNTTTQNLAYKNFLNAKYLEFTGVSSGSSFETTSTTITSPFYSSANQTNAFPQMPQTTQSRTDGNVDYVGGLSIGFWFKIDNTTAPTTSEFTSMITLNISSGETLQVGCGWHVGTSATNFGIYTRVGTDSVESQMSLFNHSAIHNTGWNYVLITYTGNNNDTYNTTASINGADPVTSTFLREPSGNSGAAATMNGFYSSGATIDGLEINTLGRDNTRSPVNGDIGIDSVVFIEGIVDNTYTTAWGNRGLEQLYQNANNPYNANLSSVQRPYINGTFVYGFMNPVIRSFIQFGEGPNDNISTAGSETIESDQGLQLSVGSATTNHSFQNFTSGAAPEEIFMDGIEDIFDVTVPSSISGWFKTPSDATGTLFSNTGGSAASGLKVDITASGLSVSYLGSTTQSVSGSFNNDEWHHLVLTKTTSTTKGFDIYMDGDLLATGVSLTLTNSLLRGDNGFTLLGDGQENAGNTSAASTDASKLAASLSNWSMHTEALSTAAISQLYSNGHVRNIKNLPSVSATNVLHWWKFSSTTNPGEDPEGNALLYYQDGASAALTSKSTLLTDGAPYIVEEDQYGSGITMSLTKRFNTTTNEWTNVHTNPTCVCLSFNGFEDQAEYFVIYNTANIQNVTDIADNDWHNIALCFSGKEGSSINATQNFCFNATTHNFVLSVDGQDVTEADYVGSLLGGTITNKCFPAHERHLKWDNNSEEDYMPHSQLNSNIFESINQTDKKYEPVVAKNYKTSYIGYADESSFHSESWFVDASGNPTTSFNNQKTSTLYGTTTTPSNRGVGTDFPPGTPYPLRRPSVIGVTEAATGNQFIDPEKYDASTNPDGGLEAWWRWGDTAGDCEENINDSIGFETEPLDAHRSLKANNYISTVEDPDGSGPLAAIPKDLFYLQESDSIYVDVNETSTGSSLGFADAIIENIQAGICNLKNLTSPILQYIRVKYTNSGEAQLGEGKVEASIHYRKRRKK